MKNKFTLERFENMSSKEVMLSLTEQELEYCIKKIRNILGDEKFNTLTQEQLEDEIFFDILIEIALQNNNSDTCPFECRITKETAQTINNYSLHLGITVSEALEHFIRCTSVDSPETAAAIAVCQTEILCAKQNDEQKIRAMFIIMGAFMKSIVNSGTYTFDEAAKEILANSDELQHILDRMKNNN